MLTKKNDNWKINKINKNKTNAARRSWHDRMIEINRKIDVDDVNRINIVN